MRIVLFFAAALMLLISACNEEGGTRVTSPNGYDYIMYSESEGETPQPGEYVYFHAQIRNGDSVLYQTRVQSPEPPFFPIPEEGVPQQREPSPIEDVLRMMSVGDSATIFVPLDSLPQQPEGFEDAEEIIYDVVMVDIKSAEEFESYREELRQEAEARAAEVKEKVDQMVAQYNAGALSDQLQETASGLKYLIQQPGSGAQASAGDMVSVHYYGALPDGSMFDNSYQRGQPITFPLGQGQVIPGWDEGIALLKEGGSAMLFIPAELGYGAAGSPPVIPPDSELIFYVELENVQSPQ